MTKSPKRNDAYPYDSMGYDIATMCNNFLGFGSDLVLPNGLRISSHCQALISMSFLKVWRTHYGNWTVNEITTFAFVVNSTIVGDVVGVKDVIAELALPKSTASHVVMQLEDREELQSYPCASDRRRKLLRLHPKAIARRIESGVSIWAEHKQNLERFVLQDQKKAAKY